MKTKDFLKSAGVRNLREFGYPDVTAENIGADPVYRQFFRSMLSENLGQGVDEDINALIAEIDALEDTPNDPA